MLLKWFYETIKNTSQQFELKQVEDQKYVSNQNKTRLAIPRFVGSLACQLLIWVR